MKKFPVRHQLIILGAIIVAAIFGGTCLVISMQRQAAIDAFETAMTNLCNGMSRQTALFFTQADQVLRTVDLRLAPSPDPSLPRIDANMQSKAVFALLSEQLSRLSGVNALILIGADGKVANTSQGWPAKPVDISGQDYFSHFKAHDDPALFAGMPALDPASGKWIVPMARRVDGAHGQFAGVVAAEISLDDLDAFYQLAMPAHRTLYLARRDGVVLSRYPPRAAEIRRRIPSNSPWYAAVAKGGGVYDGHAYFSASQTIAVVRPLHDLPFVVEASVAQTDVLLEWERARVWIVAGGILSALGAIGLLRLFGLQFHRIEISERNLAAKNAELDVTYRQLEATLAHLSQGVCFFDENNKLVVFNRRFCEIVGLSSSVVRVGMSTAEIAELRIAAGTFWDASVEEYLANLDARLRAGLPVREISELTDGRTLSKHFEPVAGHGWVMTLEDITERRLSDQKIAYLAHHDLLTGLANRALFRDRLEQAFDGNGSGKSFAMLSLDLDRFKAVNDTYGHPVGDGLLLAMADRLRGAVRSSDTVARHGGDEFVILQMNVSEKSETIVLAQRIIAAISEPFVIEGHLLNVGVSIGIAMVQGQMNPERLLQEADRALYWAKHAGRGTWRMYDPAMEAATKAGGGTHTVLLDTLPRDNCQLLR